MSCMHMCVYFFFFYSCHFMTNKYYYIFYVICKNRAFYIASYFTAMIHIRQQFNDQISQKV